MKIYVRASEYDPLVQDVNYRRAVAQRTDDPQVLTKLADDNDSAVRVAVAERTNDPNLIIKFAHDEDWLVRYAVVKKIRNPKILSELSDDESLSVRLEANKKLKDIPLEEKIYKYEVDMWRTYDEDEEGEESKFFCSESELNDYIDLYKKDIDSGKYTEVAIYQNSGSPSYDLKLVWEMSAQDEDN